MEKEKWHWVLGFEGSYLVSNLGRVMGLPKKTTYGHLMKTDLNWAGYERVCLSKNGKATYHLVHRLVAAAFIDNPGNKSEVNHKDGNRANNRVDNLEWVTRSENERHAYRVLGKQPNKPWLGKPNYFKRKFTNKQIRAIRADERPMTEIGRDYGVSKTAIRDIKTMKNYKEVV